MYLVQMYKITFGLCDIDSHLFFDFNVLAKMSRNYDFKIRPKKKTRANYLKLEYYSIEHYACTFIKQF